MTVNCAFHPSCNAVLWLCKAGRDDVESVESIEGQRSITERNPEDCCVITLIIHATCYLFYYYQFTLLLANTERVLPV